MAGFLGSFTAMISHFVSSQTKLRKHRLRLGASSGSLRQRSGSDVPQNPDLVAGCPGSVSFSYVSALRTHLELITCVSPSSPCHVSGFVCFPCRFLTVSVSASLCLVLCLLIIMLCLSCPHCLRVCLTILAFPFLLIRFPVVCFPCCFLTVACLPCVSLFRGEGGERPVRSCVFGAWRLSHEGDILCWSCRRDCDVHRGGKGIKEGAR